MFEGRSQLFVVLVTRYFRFKRRLKYDRSVYDRMTSEEAAGMELYLSGSNAPETWRTSSREHSKQTALKARCGSPVPDGTKDRSMPVCGSPVPDGEAGVSEAGVSETGVSEAGVSEAGVSEAGVSEATSSVPQSEG